MFIKAQRVSKKQDNETFCRPTQGYDSTIEIEQDHYEEVVTIDGDLPDSDLDWPQGAPLLGYAKLGNKILKKKV